MPKVSEIMESMEYGPAPEDASAVRDWLRERGRFGHFIAGRFTRPGETFASRDPSTGEELAQVTQGTPRDVMKAVRAARRAQRGWGAMPGHDRA
ncbi:aldehyde dehydrogenase family protein, partial [Paracoccus sp. PXZ]